MWCDFFFNDTATTEIYTLSLHDALPILIRHQLRQGRGDLLLERRYHMIVAAHQRVIAGARDFARVGHRRLADELRVLHRSEEHTSELQSRQYLVCRLLLEKKKATQ